MTQKIPKFSTTIKRKYLDMKLEDWRKDGYYYEYKEASEHWNKRLEKLRNFMDNNKSTVEGVFLCGQESTRVMVDSITKRTSEEKYWIPERYKDAISTDEFWVLKCILMEVKEEVDAIE